MKQYQLEEMIFEGYPEPEDAVEVDLEGIFTHKDESILVRGFYAGEGTYKIRFLPLHAGVYEYEIKGIVREKGFLTAEPAEENRHGILQPDGFHVKYSDGTLSTPFGTTIYALPHQPEELIEETFRTLENAPFNKVRLCVFPKHYQYSHNEPPFYPFHCRPGFSPEDAQINATDTIWDVKKPNFAFWDHLEKVLSRLERMGIIADLILFHPYDRWGFSRLSREDSLLYLDYALRRLSAFPNLMWSLANEYDLVPGKSMEDWYAFEEYVAARDPFGHMLSNHNCFVLYDYGRKNISHISIQTRDPSRVRSLMKYGKPVFIDECAYEGNLEETFGSLNGQEMTDRFWKVTVCGGFCTHGETFADYDLTDPDEDTVFWARGGSLKGESPSRIAYLRSFTESLPGPIDPDPGAGFAPMLYMTQAELLHLASLVPEEHSSVVNAVANMGEEERLYHLTTESEYNGHVGSNVFIRYFGRDIHGQITMNLPEDATYTIEAVDTWNMTSEVIARGKKGICKVRMPKRQWMAAVARREP